MKVYFTASARGMKSFKKHFDIIYKTIQKLGHTNIDDLLFRYEKEITLSNPIQSRANISKYAHNKLIQADVVVLEVSEPSLSIGYVTHSALELNKPVILLHTSGTNPRFFNEVQNEYLQVLEYTLADLTTTLTTALQTASSQKLIRFNFFLTAEQAHFLRKTSRSLNKSKSAYVRDLIDAQIRN